MAHAGICGSELSGYLGHNALRVPPLVMGQFSGEVVALGDAALEMLSRNKFALMLCDLCPNVSLDTSSSNSWVRYQAPEVDLKTVFGRALDVVGPRRLLFGTDSSFFPRGWNAPIFAAQHQALVDLGVSREDAQAILGGNLERLFGS